MAIRAEPDDVDRLFALLAPIPAPASLLARALVETAARQARRRRLLLVLAVPSCAAILLMLTALSLALGRALVRYDADALLALILADPRAVAVAPVDVLLAVAENLPWGLVAAVALAAIAFAGGVQLVVAAFAAPRSDRLKTGAHHG